MDIDPKQLAMIEQLDADQLRRLVKDLARIFPILVNTRVARIMQVAVPPSEFTEERGHYTD
jgi:hypothetical protein